LKSDKIYHLVYRDSFYETIMMKPAPLLILMGITVFVLTASAAAPTYAPPTSDGTMRRIRLPVLMYHYVEPLPPNADDIRRGLTVSPELFRDHLDYLQKQGYQTVSFAQVYDALMTGSPLPPKPIILTFDDGYDNHYHIVFPLLQEFGMIGTFYLITSALDEQRRGYITWEQAAQMAEAGMEIGAHTKNHVELRGRSYDVLVYEVVGSIESVTAHIGRRPITFSYPVGRYDRDTLTFMASIQPIIAVTTRSGIWVSSDQLLEVPRIRINPNTSVFALSRLLDQ
jgi:peptidoglycan/xylan/chitin deacetylase (PgdA/CDA1 family)